MHLPPADQIPSSHSTQILLSTHQRTTLVEWLVCTQPSTNEHTECFDTNLPKPMIYSEDETRNKVKNYRRRILRTLRTTLRYRRYMIRTNHDTQHST